MKIRDTDIIRFIFTFLIIPYPYIDLVEEHVPSLSIEDIKHIPSLQYEISPKEIEAIPEKDLATTLVEQPLGYFPSYPHLYALSPPIGSSMELASLKRV